MFQHVLLPLALDKPSPRVVTTVVEFAQLHGARGTLLHVIERIERLPQDELTRFYARLEKLARAKLDLIVMDSHRIVPGQLWGGSTTSYKVGIACGCPILLVK